MLVMPAGDSSIALTARRDGPMLQHGVRRIVAVAVAVSHRMLVTELAERIDRRSPAGTRRSVTGCRRAMSRRGRRTWKDAGRGERRRFPDGGELDRPVSETAG
jgi:hypothetical protein